jgi:hypothetical protein
MWRAGPCEKADSIQETFADGGRYKAPAKDRRRAMPDHQRLAGMCHAIQSGMTRTGRAPHYTELAAELGLAPEEAREALHDVFRAGVPGIWLYPNTDYVASFAPFSNLPTQYLISVEGEQKWYGQ